MSHSTYHQPNHNGNGTGTSAEHRAQAWSAAVDAVVARARKYYGSNLDARITKARHYILDDTLEVDGQFGYIPSESYTNTIYTVSNDGCDCQDAEHSAPQGMCAHRLAWDIYRGAWRQMREQHPNPMDPPPEPIPDPYASTATNGVEPLAEAPISICMRGTLAGVPGTLVTIRGHNMAEIAARAEQVRAHADCLAGMFDAVPGGDVQSGTNELPSVDEADDEPPLCPDHETEMRESKFGGWYCAERIDDDEFCTRTIGRPKRKAAAAKRRRR